MSVSEQLRPQHQYSQGLLNITQPNNIDVVDADHPPPSRSYKSSINIID